MLNDVIDSPGLLHEAIENAVSTLSQNRAFDLVEYTKYTNPADGFVYWLRTDNSQPITGSLHNRAIQVNEQDHTNSKNTIILTTQDAIRGFDEVDPSSAYFISVELDDPAAVGGGAMIVGFNSADNYYQEAGAYHYLGQAVFPNFRQFIVDDPATFLASLVPVNSLPIMLDQVGAFGVATYAAWAVPPNLTTPYISVNIENSAALHSMPFNDHDTTTNYVNQFKRDDVELVAYNLGAAKTQELIAYLYAASERPAHYGIVAIPQVRDIPVVQSEYGIRADKKSVKMSISFWLSTATAVVRKTITAANFTLEIE